MKKCINLLQCLFVLITGLLIISACSKDDDNYDGDGNIKPDVEVPDPEGTVQISMMSGNENNATFLDDNFYIGSDNNFKGSSCYCVSLGAVKGLGNVSYIPTSGWANQVAVIPGNGYVLCRYNYWSKPTFYRVYVNSNITDVNGGVLGAEVKYQKPFKGKDETISLDSKSLTFPSEGGTQTLTFKNSGVILFDSETDVPEWCSIESVSTYDQPFLTNGVAITVKENTSANARKGRITLTTLYGKETVIDVTSAGKEPYISFGMNETEVSASEQTETFEIQSNIPFDDLTVNSSVSWCKAELVNNSDMLKANSSKIKFIGQKPISETRANENSNDAYSYLLKLTFDENSSAQSRETSVVVSSKDKKTSSTLKIIQKGIVFEVKNDKIGFDKNSGYRTITINTTAKEWEAQSSDESWCTFSKNGNQITIRVTASTEDRTATITFKGFDTKIDVHQSKYAVGDTFNEKGVEGTVGYIGDEARYVYKNVGEAAWSTENVLTGANSKSDGEYNMNVIKKIDFWQDYYPAFLLCEQLNTNGVTGWYLPAIEELDKISLSYSWSSTEIDAVNSYYYYDYRGERWSYKIDNHTIYAVHKF